MTLMTWWQERAQRERTIICVAALVFLLLIIYLSFEPFLLERKRLTNALPQLREDLAWMQSHSEEIKALNGIRTSAVGEAITPAMVESALKRTGLQDQINDLRPDNAKGVELDFAEVAYADLVVLLYELRQRNGAQINKARIRALENKVGMVAVALSLGPRM